MFKEWTTICFLLFENFFWRVAEQIERNGKEINCTEEKVLWTFFFLYKCCNRKWVVNKYQILKKQVQIEPVQFSSVTQSYLTLCNPMDCSTPGFPVHHQRPELAQTQVHWVSNAIQPSHPLSSLSPPALNLSQHQDLFQWVSSSHQVAKVLVVRY